MFTTEKDISKKLTALQDDSGLKNFEFAKKYNIGITRYNHWKNGRDYLPPTTIKLIGEIFGFETEVQTLICLNCGKPFIPTNRRNLYCPNVCTVKVRNRKYKKKLSELDEKPKPLREVEECARSNNLSYGYYIALQRMERVSL